MTLKNVNVKTFVIKYFIFRDNLVKNFKNNQIP